MSEFIVIQDSQITSITKEGIHYTDDAGNAAFIDFHSCYLNYLRPRLTYDWYKRIIELNPSRDITPQSHVDRITGYKQVGRRNSIGGFIGYIPNVIYEGTGKPYFIFHTEPETIIETESEDGFWNIVKQVAQYDWQLWDET